jgi:hypothetical protein
MQILNEHIPEKITNTDQFLQTITVTGDFLDVIGISGGCCKTTGTDFAAESEAMAIEGSAGAFHGIAAAREAESACNIFFVIVVEDFATRRQPAEDTEKFAAVFIGGNDAEEVDEVAVNVVVDQFFEFTDRRQHDRCGSTEDINEGVGACGSADFNQSASESVFATNIWNKAVIHYRLLK